jgi:cephalosporin hydroxylase
MHTVDKIIDEAYKLYMPQIRSEILSLTNTVMWNMVSKKEPYNILEIGTKYGGTFHIWSSINCGDGMNISIDMSDGGKHGGISEEEMDKRDLWFSELFDNVHFIRGNSHDTVTRAEVNAIGVQYNATSFLNIGTQTFLDKWIDFLFIDGDHTKEGVKKDFEMYSPLVKKGGIVAFHDIVISDHHHSRDVYVGEFWNEIKEQYRHIEFVEEGNNWGGIGCLFM